MKNLFKKNQLMITALAIMIAIAGYLQFAGTDLEEKYLKKEDHETKEVWDSSGVVQEIPSLDGELDIVMEDYPEEEDSLFAQVVPKEGEIPGEAVFTSTGGTMFLSDAKLMKEQTRAKNKETLLQIIDNLSLSDGQKQEAVDSMVHMTEVAEKETAAEILLEAKGFSDVVVSISKDAADVVVNALELTDAQRAQIEDIIRRKTGISAENIIISTVVE